MLFIEGDVRYVIDQARDGYWYVYDTHKKASSNEGGYNGFKVVVSNLESKEEAQEVVRNLQS